MSERAHPAPPEEGTEPERHDRTELSDEQPTEPAPPATGADAAIAALTAAGVEHVFGVQGGAIMPVYDALAEADDGPTHLTMAHEQAAAHAADAYGQVTGEPGVCMATSGPGATNLITGIADADMDSDPVVALTGQVPTEFLGNDAFQETDTVGVTRPITKENYFAGDADRIGATVSEAVELAGAGRPGPTLVDLPKDASTTETAAGPEPGRLPTYYDVPDRADESAIEAAAAAFEAAERPLVLAGGGVVKAEASEELRAFVNEADVPVVTTMPGIGTVPEDDERCLSWAGMHGTGAANMAVSHTDCLFAVGTRFDDRLTGGVETFAPDATVIHADIDAAEISKNVEADHALVGDAAAVIEQMHDAMATGSSDGSETDTGSDRHAAWREQCREWQDDYPMTYAAPEDEPLKPQFVVEAADAATPDDAVVTAGVGQHQMWAAQYWTFRHPRSWVASHGLGTMGYGLPAAIGAKLAAPDREVVCFEGDGSFLMTLQELSVAARENLDVTVIVLNNEAIGMVRQWQDAFFEGRHTASEYGWVPEFAAIAEAFGAKGFTLETYDEVADTLEAAFAHDGPSVVDARIDPRENVYPMVESGGDNSGFALAEDQL
ncbi:biosynthetic-type acetolactate synthase large subunit [Halolamina litorea]|uniref:Acetolactate synthase n=1 Tax=Halolamina litorea TaxID=1515593 RepID=A0ABD6BRJ9_9EURY|nr:biosynthetic-type acetolactate synthase large subunit [Halolamina litorea]